METYHSHGHYTGFVCLWQQHPQPMVLSASTINLMLALCVIVSLISLFFFFFFFFRSHPICENFSPGALLYQAPAAAVILDMAGSRYRKTARAHSAQKNLEIPLIYPRLWLQSKLVEKENEKREEGKLAGRNAQVDNCIWAVCVRKESFSHHLLQRTGGILYMAMWDGKCLAGSSILWLPPSPRAKKSSSCFWRGMCFSSLFHVLPLACPVCAWSRSSPLALRRLL